MTRSVCACLLGSLVLTAGLGACASPDPALYTIAPVTGAIQSYGAKIVLLERMEIPRYLDRSQIVRSSEDYRLDLKSNDWWGEPLGTMLRRVLQQELAQRLPASVVLTESGAVNASPDVTIDLDLQRLDEDKDGNVVLQAEASVSFKSSRAPTLRSFHLTAPPPTVQGATGEVAAISITVGQLADGLVAMLAGR
jgi:uncharacterized lipoprotein YmbA